jgi:hypothetical protein
MRYTFIHVFKKHPISPAQNIEKIMFGSSSKEVTLQLSLYKLINLLYEATGKKIVLLVDEFDTPLRAAYVNTPAEDLEKNSSYYQQMIALMHNVFSLILEKSNPYLFRVMLVGITRPPLDKLWVPNKNMDSPSDFIKVYSVLEDSLSEYFGFTFDEVRAQLREAFGLLADDHLFKQVSDYYGGYRIGQNLIFCPWSISCFIDDNRRGCSRKGFVFKPYWLNTGGNEQISQLVLKSNKKFTFKKLLQNKPIHAIINKHMELTDTTREMWSFLLFTGYLTLCNSFAMQSELIIPNQELYQFYEHLTKHWFEEEKVTKSVQAIHLGLFSSEEQRKRDSRMRKKRINAAEKAGQTDLDEELLWSDKECIRQKP